MKKIKRLIHATIDDIRMAFTPIPPPCDDVAIRKALAALGLVVSDIAVEGKTVRIKAMVKRRPDWIDCAERRSVEETDLEPHVYTVKPGCDEAVHDFLRSDKPVPEKLRELMADRKVE